MRIGPANAPEATAHGAVPDAPADPGWALVLPGEVPLPEAVEETLLTVGDGRFGTRGVREERPSSGAVLANGVYDESSPELPVLLPGPGWTSLDLAPGGHAGGNGGPPAGPAPVRRVLDLATGVLHREGPDGLRTARFACLARPGVAALRAAGPAGVLRGAGRALDASGAPGAEGGRTDAGEEWAATRALRGGIAAAAAQAEHAADGLRVVERIVGLAADRGGPASPADALALLAQARAAGFDALLAEQRAAWASVWEDCRVDVDGDPDTQLAARFALFHLVASTPTTGEAALGARGLAGPGYAGHVFWDADVFALPALAAVRPEAARAMLEYRVARLDEARANARRYGRAGARFPWESARDGAECTPDAVVDARGNVVPVETGEHEEHIVADVAWAAWQYVRWTGDTEFRDGAGRHLVTEAARYWAARVEPDGAGRLHIRDVIGPDEYHEHVDDNAFTNVMARWTLRLAARLVESDGIGGAASEPAAWRAAADALVDGFDPTSGRYEQYEGFSALRPFPHDAGLRPPVPADAVLGRAVTTTSQVVKQADVLMLHLMVPEEVAPGSLRPNLARYGPITVHGSSLSPAVHAALLARAGSPDEGLGLLRLASHLDLANLNDTTATGLHIATMGGLWQALALGYAGLRADGDTLAVDPQLPASWTSLGLRVRLGPARVRVVAGHGRVEVASDAPFVLRLPDGTRVPLPGGEAAFAHNPLGGWRPV